MPRVSLEWRDPEQPKADWLLPYRLWYFTCDVSRFSMLHDASSKLRCFPARCDMPCSYVFLKERYALSSHFPFSPLPNGISSWGMMKKSDKPRNSSFRIQHVDCLVSALSDLSTRFNLIPCLSMYWSMRLIRFYRYRYTLSPLHTLAVFIWGYFERTGGHHESLVPSTHQSKAYQPCGRTVTGYSCWDLRQLIMAPQYLLVLCFCVVASF